MDGSIYKVNEKETRNFGLSTQMETRRIRLHSVNRIGNPYGEILVAHLFCFMLMRE